jgi:predicted AAA+ superfamily ATPase
MLIPRKRAEFGLQAALARSRVVALVGPRQCGKTTLAQAIAAARGDATFFDLEDPAALEALAEPMSTLGPLRGLVIIDEVQRRPDLFPILRVLADRLPLPARFLVLGSASPQLLQQASESLAGRVEIVELGGLALEDVGAGQTQKLWLRGGMPRAFLADTAADSFAWRRQFLVTFLERDVPTFGVRVPAASLMRFWTMVAHYHAQIWNGAELARSLGVGEDTARRYLDLLESLFMVRVLRPWHANLAKRQVKSPKVLLRDSGLLHALLGIRTETELLTHPKLGASWEGLVIEQVLHRFEADEAYFWATHAGAELDLLLRKDGRMYGVECKRTDAPKLTPSMRTALQGLGLEYLWVMYPGTRAYKLADRIEAVPFAGLAA